MPRQKVEFAANVPTQVILESLGTMQPNQHGEPEYRYMLADEKIMWVPPAVHAQIGDYATESETVTITKRQTKPRAPITWTVEREPAHRSNGYSAAHYDRPQPPAPPTMPEQQRGGRAWQPPAAPTAELPITSADRMAQAMRDAIELWRAAAHMEPALNWNAGDVRALAATLFIEGGKR